MQQGECNKDVTGSALECGSALLYRFGFSAFSDRHGIWGEVWNELWTAAARRRFLSLRGPGVTLPLLSLCWHQSG